MRIPKLGKYVRPGRKPLGRVILGGKAHYCGEYGTAECREAYERLISEWLARGRKPAPPPPERLLVARLAADYLRHALVYYRKNGRATTEVDGIRAALRSLLRLYSRCPVAEFNAPKLVAVRDSMVHDVIDPSTGEVTRKGMARSSINGHVMRIKKIFRWGIEQGLVPAEVMPGLDAVRGLQQGRSAARETEPVKPAPIESVNAVLKRVSSQVAAMVHLQCLTGARPGEVCSMRPADVKRDGDIWEFIPERHKTEHHGKGRVVMIGPRAQAVLEPFLENRPADAFCFSPKEAEQERLEKRHADRKTPMSCGNRPGSNKTTKRKHPIGEFYTADSYRRAIRRVCEDLKIEIWTPHQLRHSFATTARQSHGIEAAQACLGHAGLKATEIYAERDATLARKVAAEIG